MMKNRSKHEKPISRRDILPLLGGGLLIPFLGFGSSINEENDTIDEEYQVLLKPDGTSVKVKVSTLKKSKIVKKNISNNSLLKWLDRKF